MSRHENDRKSQSKTGKTFPSSKGGPSPVHLRSAGFAAAIAAALTEEFGQTGAAVKTVASITGANERAVRNWFEAKNGPTGAHLVDLMQHSDRVLETMLLLAGRGDASRAVMLATLCSGLRDLLARIEASGTGGPLTGKS